MNRPDSLYERRIETILWAGLKIWWLNQLIGTDLNIAWNPEHGDMTAGANIGYTISDFWKADITAVMFSGPAQSLFGRYSRNDQIEAETVYAW